MPSRPTTEQFSPHTRALGVCTRPAPAGRGVVGRRRVNYRYYNPTDGRWTRRDPIGIEGGVNLYGYVFNMPHSYTDMVGNIQLSSTPSRHFQFRSAIRYNATIEKELIAFLYLHYIYGHGQSVEFDAKFIDNSDDYKNAAKRVLYAAYDTMKQQRIYNKTMYTVDLRRVLGSSLI